MTCLPHPLYTDDTRADEWMTGVGAVAGFLSSLDAGPFSDRLAALALVFGAGSAFAANYQNGEMDWGGFTRSMAILVAAEIVYESNPAQATHLFIGKKAEGIISALKTSGMSDIVAAQAYGGVAALVTGTFLFDPLINKLLDSCAGNDRTYGQQFFQNILISPLVIDMDRDNNADEIPLRESPVFFSPGALAPEYGNMAIKTSWIAPDDGLLALDINMNGVIDGRGELFGNEPSRFTDGFKKLAQYDVNQDNVINSADAVYTKLLVWQDQNTNGYSETGELRSLHATGITAINLNATNNISTVNYQGGGTGKIWDIWFASEFTNSVYLTTAPFAPDVFDLPQLDGIGRNKDLWRAMTDDAVLRAMAESFKSSVTSIDLASYRDGFENILFRWFGVEWLASSDGVPYVDDRVFYAMASMTTGLTTPQSQFRGDSLQAAWDGYVNTTLLKFVAQIPTSEMAEAFYLSLERLKQLQDTGTNLDTLTVAQIEAHIRPFFDAGGAYARNHPLKALGLDYDFDQDILKGKMGTTLEGLVAGIPTNTALQQSYWNNQLLIVDGLARTNLGMGFSVTPLQDMNRIVGTGSAQTLTGGAAHDLIFGEGGNDVLNGGDGDDMLFGGIGNDTLIGEGGQNTFYWNAGFGNDVVNNQSSSASLWDQDTLIIGKGVDPETVLVSSSGNDIILRDPVTQQTVTLQQQLSSIGITEIASIMFERGEVWDSQELENIVIAAGITEGNDVIYGFFGNNAINGRGGNDTIYGAGWYDTIEGGDGNDVIDGGEQADVLIGGAGADVFRLAHPSYSVTNSVDIIKDFAKGIDKLNLSGLGFTGLDTDGGDTEAGELRLQYNSAENRTYVITDQTTFEFCLEGNYAQGANKLTNADVIFSGGGVMSLTGSRAVDSINGTSLSEAIYGFDSNDTLFGSSGDDTLVGGAGADSLNGSSGSDTASYEGSAAVVVNLATGTTSGGHAAGDILVSIENLTGGAGADVLTGNTSSNVLLGNGGNDTLIGESGNDTLDGGADKDILTGGAGADVFKFSSITHSLETSTSIDRITDFVKGTDKLDLTGLGFTGLDTDGGNTEAGELRLAYSATNNRTYLRTEQSTFEFYLDGDYTQGANLLTNTDFIFGVSTPTITGSAAADSLTGTDASEVINGLAGIDTLIGGAGNDTLNGGSERDTLTGGAGADVFKFSTLTDSNDSSSSTYMDRITDFVKGTDKFDLTGLGFTGFDTDGGTTEAGELRLAYSSSTNRTYVRTDQSTFEFYLDGNYTQGANLLANADFLF